MLPMVTTQSVPDTQRIEVDLRDIAPGTLVTVLIVPANLTAPVIDAAAARRAANGWLTDYVGDMVLARAPQLLSDGRHTWWRLAAYVTNVYREPFGPVGFVDVDAVSGAVLADEQTAQELQAYGARLERHPLAARN